MEIKIVVNTIKTMEIDDKFNRLTDSWGDDELLEELIKIIKKKTGYMTYDDIKGLFQTENNQIVVGIYDKDDNALLEW